MTAPLRLLDDGTCSTELRKALTQLPTEPALPPAVHAKLAAFSTQLAAVGLGGAAVLGTATAKAATLGSATLGTATAATQGTLLAKAVTWVVSAKVLTQVVIGTALVTAFVTAGYFVADPILSTTQKKSQPTLRVPRSIPSQSVTVAVSYSVKPEAKAVVGTEPEAKPLPFGVKPTTKAGESAAQTEQSHDESAGLTREARMLEAARATLGSEPSQSLEITREHGKLFPQGQLSDERELIAVDALLRLGRRNEAWLRAEPRLREAPKSLYAKRLRQLFGTIEVKE